MVDQFKATSDHVAAPSRNAYPITPHDSNELPSLPKGIYVGTGGTVVLRAVDSQVDVTYKNLLDGGYIAVRAAYVRATGTTAADLVGEA